jgi:hypothetical protein
MRASSAGSTPRLIVSLRRRPGSVAYTVPASGARLMNSSIAAALAAAGRFVIVISDFHSFDIESIPIRYRFDG